MDQGESELKPPLRPGGPLEIKPIVIDGVVYDPYNAPKLFSDRDGNLSFVGGKPLKEDGSLTVEGNTEDKDVEYTNRFWSRNQPKGLKEVMIEIVHKAAIEHGSIGSFVNPKGLDEKDKEKLSAYRTLARELGYEVGEYRFDPSSHTAAATIKKPGEK